MRDATRRDRYDVRGFAVLRIRHSLLRRAQPWVCVLPALFMVAIANAAQGDLSVRIDDGLTHTTPGRPIHYTVTTRNAGPDAVDGLLITATLPATGCTWTCNSTAGQCRTSPALGADLPSGATARHTAACTAASDAAGTWTSTALLQPPAGFVDPDSANDQSADTTQVVPRGILDASLTDDVSHLVPGDPVAYGLAVRNDGPDPMAGARVTTALPSQYIGCTWSCSGGGGSACASSGSGNVDDVVHLPSGGTVNYAINCTVAAGASGVATTTTSVQPPAGSTSIDPALAAGAPASDSNVLLASPVPDAALDFTGPASIVVTGPFPDWTANYRVFAINRGGVDAPVQFAAHFPTQVNLSCVTPGCTIVAGTGQDFLQNITLPPHARWEVVAGGTGNGLGVFEAYGSLTRLPADPTPDNVDGVSTVVSAMTPPSPPSDVGISLVSALPARAAFGDTMLYRFRVAAPSATRTNATIVLPAYVRDALPTCAATTGNATCSTALPFRSWSGDSFRYGFSIALGANETADLALTARIGERIYADYWNEIFRVTAEVSGSIDTNPSNNRVDADIALSLFRSTFETP